MVALCASQRTPRRSLRQTDARRLSLAARTTCDRQFKRERRFTSARAPSLLLRLGTSAIRRRCSQRSRTLSLVLCTSFFCGFHQEQSTGFYVFRQSRRHSLVNQEVARSRRRPFSDR